MSAAPVPFALAPAFAGVVSLLLGIVAAARLTDPIITGDEAALRLFAGFFLLFGFWFLSDAIRGLRATHNAARPPAGPGFLLLATIVVGVIAAPFNFLWTTSWTLFQSLVFAIDLVFAILLVRTIARIWQRRRGTPVPPPATMSMTRARVRQRRLTFVALMLGSMGLLVGWLGAKQGASDWTAWSRLQRVEGVVARQVSFNFRGRDGRPAPNAAAVIRYQVDGKSYETIQRIDPASTSRFQRSARVQIVYDPSAPQRGRLANAYETFLISGALLMTAVIFLGLAGMCVSRAAAIRD